MEIERYQERPMFIIWTEYFLKSKHKYPSLTRWINEGATGTQTKHNTKGYQRGACWQNRGHKCVIIPSIVYYEIRQCFQIIGMINCRIYWTLKGDFENFWDNFQMVFLSSSEEVKIYLIVSDGSPSGKDRIKKSICNVSVRNNWYTWNWQFGFHLN